MRDVSRETVGEMFHVKRCREGEMFHVKRSREGEMFHVKQKRVAFRSPAGACLLCRLLTLPLVGFSAPIPPTPFPAGRGRFLVYFAGGWRPRHPCYRSRAALVIPSGRNHLNITGNALVNAYL